MALDYLFNPGQIKLEFKDEINYKYIALIYLEQFKKQLSTHQRETAKLYFKLNELRKEKEDEDLYEGFHSGEEDQQYEYELQNDKPLIQEENAFAYTKRDIEEKDKIIEALNKRIKQREQNLVQITAGYLKDLHLLREQLFRGSEENYQVSYLDVSDIIDPKQKELLNLHIDQLKMQYEQQTNEMKKQIDNQRAEIKSLKNQNQYLTNIAKNMDTPFDMISKAVRIEPNPYKVWKIIQDVKGTFFFQEVFENQKAAYGINYREINQLLMSSKAYEREYTQYKKQQQEQMAVFYNKTMEEIQEARSTLLKKENEIEELRKMMEKEKKSLKYKIIEEMNDQQNQDIKKLKNQHYKEMERYAKLNDHLDQYKMHHMVKLWASLSYLAKMKLQKDQQLDTKSIKKIMIEGSFTTEKINELKDQLANLNDDYNKQKIQMNDLQLDHRILEDSFIETTRKYDSLLIEFQDLKNRLVIENNVNRKLQNEKQIIETCCNQIVQLIDPQLANVKIKDLQLNNTSSELIKDFMKRIHNLSSHQKKSIQELKESELKADFAYSQFVDLPEYANQLIQTDIQDITIDLGRTRKKQGEKRLNSLFSVDEDSELEEENNSNMKSKQSVQIQTEQQEENNQFGCEENEKNLQTNLRLKDIEKFTKTIQELKEDLKKNKIETRRYKTLLKAFEGKPSSSNSKRSQSQIYSLGTVFNVGESNRNSSQQNGRIHAAQTKTRQSKLMNKIEKPKKQIFDIDLSIDGSRTQSRNTNRLKEIQLQNEALTTNSFAQQQNIPLSSLKPKQKYSLTENKDKMEKELRKKNTEILNPINSRNERKQIELFERLYEESKKKSENIKELKFRLQVLERSHWEDILNIFNQQKESQYERIEISTINFLEKQKESHSFQFKTTQDYYKKIKEKQVDNKSNRDVYQNWFGRQRIQMERMIDNFDMMTKQKHFQMRATSYQFSPKPDSKNTTGFQFQVRSQTQQAKKQRVGNQFEETASKIESTPLSLLPKNITDVVKKKFKIK